MAPFSFKGQGLRIRDLGIQVPGRADAGAIGFCAEDAPTTTFGLHCCCAPKDLSKRFLNVIPCFEAVPLWKSSN